MTNDTAPFKFTALILAGGRAQRMAGNDKGLLRLHDKPLIAWLLERLNPLADEILISANRNLDAYGAFGHPVLSDASPDFNGPLAGLLRGLETARNPLLLCVPCDTPFLLPDLPLKLWQALEENQAQIAVAATRHHVHRTVCLCRRELAESLAEFLAQGCRQVGSWQATLKAAVVPFEDEAAFANINTPEELAAATK
ncbi:MAG: molybdenum cofactor guanylyltransferase [Sulfuricella sp.]|nr:molybdenum cofactor guanylyltransferase [Sulfuricella sp.]